MALLLPKRSQVYTSEDIVFVNLQYERLEQVMPIISNTVEGGDFEQSHH